MQEREKVYIAIDLKSFYASAECVERGLDPLNTNLVVADQSRTDGTICLAVSPPLKALGVPGRPRLYEAKQKVAELNALRRGQAPKHILTCSSIFLSELLLHPEAAIDFIIAVPRMALYLDYSTRVYKRYLQYIAPEDIHVYSVDEVFMDVSNYLSMYKTTPHDLAMRIIRDVLQSTGITATAGIGPNLYLAKVAMDVEAKHIAADKDGVRIAELSELSYRQKLWTHRPLTDFWRVGRGSAKRLERCGIYTMGDIARCSLSCEDLLFRMFGIQGELIVDHAWGWEPCTMADIKAYRPETNSLGSGQVLPRPYNIPEARLIVREMTDALSLDLAGKKLVTDQIVLDLAYDSSSLNSMAAFEGLTADHYGHMVPKPSHGSRNLPWKTHSTKRLVAAALGIFDEIALPGLFVRRVAVTANRVVSQSSLVSEGLQMDLFSTPEDHIFQQEEKEARLQEAILSIRERYGKNALLKAFNLQDGATMRERNQQIGGHKK